MTAIEQATPEAARVRAERIRAGMRVLAKWQDDVIAAYVARDWAALGYETWDAYLDGEYGENRVQLPRDQRREIVAGMAQAGMSTRAIGAALNVDQKTIVNDRARSTEEVSSVPERVLSLDGRERPAARPTPSPRPATDTAPALRAAAIPEPDVLGGDNWIEVGDADAGPHSALFEEPADRAAEDARLDESLAAQMEDSAVVFRANFRPKVTAAYVMAKDADVGRITHVYAALGGDRDALIRDLRFIRDFCDRASEALSKTVQIRSAGGSR